MDFFNLFTPDGVMLEPGVIYTVIALMFLYTFVGICAGFGGGLTTMPLITLMLPVKMATPLSVIVGTATAIYATWLSRKETDWRSAAVLIGFSFLGIPVGLYALSYLPDHIMKLRNLGPAAFRGTLNAFFTANNIAVVGGLATSGILTISTFKLVIFCIPTMILGSLVGQYVHKRISVKVFRVLVFLLLIASGAMLIKGALGVSAATALLPPFVLLAILQILLGKKIAEIRKVDASK